MPAGSASTHRTARLLAPDLLVREQTQTLSCPMYSDGALVAPSGGTVTVYRPDGSALVDAASVAIVSDVATYSLSSSVLDDSESYGGRWALEWTLTFSSGVTPEIVPNDAAVVRRLIRPTVTDADLYRRASSLDPNGSSPITASSTYQDKIDLAWGMILRDIIAQGQRPDLIVTPSALHDAHLMLSLALVFEDLSTRLEEAYLMLADRYKDEYGAALRRMTYGVDTNNDGVQDTSRRRKARGTTWLGGSPSVVGRS